MLSYPAALMDASRTPTRPQVSAFLLEFGRDLHQTGTPAHRLEETLQAIADQLGIEAQFFSTPTSLILAIGPETSQRTHLLRIEPSEVDLDRMIRVDDAATRVARGQIDPDEGIRALREIERTPLRYPRWLIAVCFGVASASAGVFFGGSWQDSAVGGMLGVLVGILAITLGSSMRFARVSEALAGMIVAALTILLDHLVPLTQPLVIVSALIVLLPGLTLTLAVNELATRHLVSGTARMAHAATILVAVALGVSIGVQLDRVLPASEHLPPAGVPSWLQWPTLVPACLSFTVLFRIRVPMVLPIMLIAASGYLAAKGAGMVLGSELGAGIGAMTVGLGANAWSRITDKPAAVCTLPAIIMLVPGALGFRGVVALAGSHTVQGVEGVVGAVLVASSLVMGLLLATVILPARKTL